MPEVCGVDFSQSHAEKANSKSPEQASYLRQEMAHFFGFRLCKVLRCRPDEKSINNKFNTLYGCQFGNSSAGRSDVHVT